MRLGGGGMASNIPLQQQKADIVNKLLKMTGSMKEYSTDIEDRLDRAQKAMGVIENKKPIKKFDPI